METTYDMENVGEAEKIFLCAGYEFGDAPLAKIFGEMVKRSVVHMDSYQSDLYHDADWIRNWVTGPGTFYWVVRDSGTWIAKEPDWLPLMTDQSRYISYRITITEPKPQQWFVTFQKVQRADG